MKNSNRISSTGLGRILLHIGCGIRRPSHWHWHWHGIQRELSFAHCSKRWEESLSSCNRKISQATIAFCFLLLAWPVAAQGKPDETFPSEMHPGAAAAQVIGERVLQPRIVGGRPGTIGEFPYQVALLSAPYNPTDLFDDQFCGGSILNERWILTAAHCIDGSRPSSVAVAVGVTDLRHPQSGRIFAVDQIFVHPDYDPSTSENDVALLHLTAPIDFSNHSYVAASVRLVTPADAQGGVTDPGVLAAITGWGTISLGGASPPNLMAATVHITTNAAYRPGRVTADMIMAGYAAGAVDTCQGDSGGPLVVTNIAGVVLQAGITSWGNGCAKPDYPGVYSRVSYHYDWITRQVAGMPPTNDNFPAARVIDGVSGSVRGSSINATKEAGEPNHAGSTGGRSVWYTWVAPTSGVVTIDTAGSSFNTTLGVYTGSFISSLTSIASNDNSGMRFTSAVSFLAVAGTTYQIAVDGYDGASGNIELNIAPTSTNDLFTNRIVISGVTDVVTGSNIGGTKEPGEPAHGGNAGGKSVWWSWTAPTSGKVSMTTDGSSFDTLLGVYIGSSVSGLTLVDDDDDSGVGAASAVRFAAIAGTSYQIAVDGYGGAFGNITLKVLPVAPLHLLPLQRLADGTCRIWIGSTNGTAIDPTRIPAIEVYASSSVLQPLDRWTRLTGNLTVSNGLLRIDDPAARNLPMRFYCVSERP